MKFYAQLVLNQWAGLYKRNDQNLYINVGIGVAGPPVRIGVDPEITFITLTKCENFAEN